MGAFWRHFSIQVSFFIHLSLPSRHLSILLITMFEVRGFKVVWLRSHCTGDGLLPELPFVERDYTVLSSLPLLLRLLLLSLLARDDDRRGIDFSLF